MSAIRLTALVVGRPAAPDYLDVLLLDDPPVITLDVRSVSDITHAIELLTHEEYDVLLYHLAGARPTDRLRGDLAQLRRLCPSLALIVFGAGDGGAAALLPYVSAGADDALPAAPGRRELERALLFAIERRTEPGREGALLVRFAAAESTAVTSTLFGGTVLRLADPAGFEELTQRYAAIMELAIEERAFRKSQQAPAQLRALAEALGTMRASPRDVVELHTAALGVKLRGGQIGRIQGYVEEGKLLLLELMGDLVAFYRNYAAVFWTRPRERATTSERPR